MNIDEVKIVNLIDEQEYLNEVSEWIWKEWSKSNGAKLEDIIYRSKHSIKKEGIPQMYIAKYKNEVVGVVSLWRNDLISRQDLFPWMATLYVKENFRNIGIGKKLQYKCIEETKKMNYEDLYLITEHKSYYERTGWRFLENAPLGNGKYTRIYKYKLKDDNCKENEKSNNDIRD